MGLLFLILYPSAGSADFVTHSLSHTNLSHTIFHAQLCHTPSFTHNFATPSFTHDFVIHPLSHTTFSHTIFDTQLRHLATWTFVWQAWHLATSTFVSRGRRGTYGTGLALVVRLGPLGHPWRRGTLRGRRGTWRHRPSFCVAGVALMELGWLWWRGRRGTWRHGRRICVAGVALGDTQFRFTWQAWHLWHWAGSVVALVARARHFAWQAWHLATWTFVSRGRRGSWQHRPSFRVAGVALVDTYGTGLALAARLGPLGRHLATWTFHLRGRRATSRHEPSICMAGVATYGTGLALVALVPGGSICII